MQLPVPIINPTKNQIKKKRKKKELGLDLIAVTSVLELGRVEAWTAAEEVVNFTGLDIVGKAGDEQRVDPRSIPLGVVVVRIVRW